MTAGGAAGTMGAGALPQRAETRSASLRESPELMRASPDTPHPAPLPQGEREKTWVPRTVLMKVSDRMGGPLRNPSPRSGGRQACLLFSPLSPQRGERVRVRGDTRTRHFIRFSNYFSKIT